MNRQLTEALNSIYLYLLLAEPRAHRDLFEALCAVAKVDTNTSMFMLKNHLAPNGLKNLFDVARLTSLVKILNKKQFSENPTLQKAANQINHILAALHSTHEAVFSSRVKCR